MASVRRVHKAAAAPFKGTQQTQVVHVRNDTETQMAFKVKTTAPKLYCVRPNSGVLPPGEAAPVTIIFQGLAEEPALGYKCKDKFLFVSIPCLTQVNPKDVSTNWAQLEQLAGGKTSDVKLKVLFNYDNPMNTIQEEDKSNTSAHSASLPIQNNIPVSASNGTAPVAAARRSDRELAAAGASTTGVASNITGTTARGTTAVAGSATSTDAPPAVEKPFAHVAPPAAATKASSNETNIYLIAVVLLILAFLVSRFF